MPTSDQLLVKVTQLLQSTNLDEFIIAAMVIRLAFAVLYGVMGRGRD